MVNVMKAERNCATLLCLMNPYGFGPNKITFVIPIRNYYNITFNFLYNELYMLLKNFFLQVFALYAAKKSQV